MLSGLLFEALTLTFKVKKFIILPAKTAVTPDQVYDTYVDIDDDLEIDCNICNMLIAKAKY